MPSKDDPDLRQRALRMLAEARPEHESLTAACRHIGGLLGVSPETLRVWQRRYDIDTGVKLGASIDMAEENRRLRREVTELARPTRPSGLRACFSRRNSTDHERNDRVHRGVS